MVRLPVEAKLPVHMSMTCATSQRLVVAGGEKTAGSASRSRNAADHREFRLMRTTFLKPGGDDVS